MNKKITNLALLTCTEAAISVIAGILPLLFLPRLPTISSTNLIILICFFSFFSAKRIKQGNIFP